MKNWKLLGGLLSCGLALPALADVKLPSIFGNGMVMQRDKPVALWGWADAGEIVTVVLADDAYTAVPDAAGRWQVMLKATPAGGPYTLTVAGKNRIQLTDVLFGDVWLCSGQSNMEWRIKSSGIYGNEAANSTNPNIRLIEIANTKKFSPQTDVVSTGWKAASPTTAPDFSAVAYFFAKTLYERYQVPIGLISSEWGGTIAEAWASRESLQGYPRFLRVADSLGVVETEKSRVPMEQRMDDYREAIRRNDQGYANRGAYWSNPVLATADWKKMDLPVHWEEAGLPGVDGIVWFRKVIDVPKEAVGKDIRLTLGQIDDADSTYFNGERVGFTDNRNTVRQYTVPGRLVKAGRNVIAIRVLDTSGNGGIWGDANDLVMEMNGQGISLAGAWDYKLSVNLRDLPPNPAVQANNPNVPTVLFNGMIAPLLPYGIKGAIWYQGESNASRAYEYQNLFPTLIADWRKQFGQGDFPFLFVQLANFMAVKPTPGESAWAELREAQSMTLNVANTGQAVIIELGETDNIHPKNKLDVGRRLALAAQRVAYGDQTVVHSGPTYKAMVREDDKIRLGFDQIAGGLTAKNSPDSTLKGFAIAGEDKKWVWANAKIDRNTVVVWSDQVKNPVAVRYAWADNPEGCNLYNAADLPASPFRTDTWKGLTQK
ncbi:MAG: sialate O-acetylesterase [Cytophagaceae bacterium]|nr:sialate O-acetylesterase [Cytophagaceae bacterium]